MNSWVSSTQRYGHTSELWEHTQGCNFTNQEALFEQKTFMCFLLKCYVLSVSPGQSWIFVRSKIPIIPFPLLVFVQYETFQIISKKMRTNFSRGNLILLSLAGNSPGFQSKNRYLSEESIWFSFGSCDGCLLQEPWSIEKSQRKENTEHSSYLPNTQSKCSIESLSASLLMKRSSFTKERFQIPFQAKSAFGNSVLRMPRIKFGPLYSWKQPHVTATSVGQLLCRVSLDDVLKSTLNWWSEVCNWKRPIYYPF